MLKTVSLAAIVAFAATTSYAGSLAQPVEDDNVEAFVPVGGSGIGTPAIVGGIIAAVAVAALISNDDDDDAAATTEVAD
ncbi:MAG: hypothetical protein ABJJ53_12105 [Sulfitobacter sp.]